MTETIKNTKNRIGLTSLLGGIVLLGGCDLKPQNNFFETVKTDDGYETRITQEGIKTLEERCGIPANVSINYDSSFFREDTGLELDDGCEYVDIVELYQNGVAPEVANSYNTFLFDKDDIKLFVQWGVSPEEAMEYVAKYEFSPEEAIQLNGNGVSPALVEKYRDVNGRFNATAILKLHEDGITPEDLATYPVQVCYYSGCEEYKDYIRLGYTPEMIKAQEWEVQREIEVFAENDIHSKHLETLLQYHESFNASDKVNLFRNGISPEDANRYGDLNEKFGRKVRINGEDIITYKEEGISFDDIRERVLDEVISESITN